MRLSRHHPKDYPQLLTLAKEAVGDVETVVVHAGHFLLFFDDEAETIRPCILSELKSEKHRDFLETHGKFPFLTWKLGVQLLNDLSVKNKKILIIVNDWQYVPSQADRAQFYSEYRELPECYSNLLLKEPAAIDLVVPEEKGFSTGISTAPFFSEMNLRNRYKKRIRKMIKQSELPPGAELANDDGLLSCAFPSINGENREIYCDGKTGNCAGEVAQLISEIAPIGERFCFINFFPLVCQPFVEQGTKDAVDLFATDLNSVLNVGLKSSFVVDDADLTSSSKVTLQLFS